MFEIAIRHRSDAYRAIYAVQLGAAVYVIDAFQKKSKAGIRTPQVDGGQDRDAPEAAQGGFTMKGGLDLVHGSGNVFRDFGHPDAELEQAKAVLAARIIQVMDERGWTARTAEKETGVGHTDLSRIRNVRLDRFTLDRLVTILGRFDQEIEINVRPRSATGSSAQIV